MSVDESREAWEIGDLRQSIANDWKALASEDLDSDTRRHVREHLQICTTALKNLREREQSPSKAIR